MDFALFLSDKQNRKELTYSLSHVSSFFREQLYHLPLTEQEKFVTLEIAEFLDTCIENIECISAKDTKTDCCPSCGYPLSNMVSCGYCESYPEVRGPVDSIQELARRVLFIAESQRNSLLYRERYNHKIEAHEINTSFDGIVSLCKSQIERQ